MVGVLARTFGTLKRLQQCWSVDSGSHCLVVIAAILHVFRGRRRIDAPPHNLCISLKTNACKGVHAMKMVSQSCSSDKRALLEASVSKPGNRKATILPPAHVATNYVFHDPQPTRLTTQACRRIREVSADHQQPAASKQMGVNGDLAKRHGMQMVKEYSDEGQGGLDDQDGILAANERALFSMKTNKTNLPPNHVAAYVRTATTDQHLASNQMDIIRDYAKRTECKSSKNILTSARVVRASGIAKPGKDGFGRRKRADQFLRHPSARRQPVGPISGCRRERLYEIPLPPGGVAVHYCAGHSETEVTASPQSSNVSKYPFAQMKMVTELSWVDKHRTAGGDLQNQGTGKPRFCLRRARQRTLFSMSTARTVLHPTMPPLVRMSTEHSSIRPATRWMSSGNMPNVAERKSSKNIQTKARAA